MRRFWLGVLGTPGALVLAVTVGLPAQNAPPAGDKPPEVGKTVTVDGCLQIATAPAGAAAASSKFVLAVKPAGGGRGSAGPRYRLDGDEKAMAPHQNHVVEVNGTVQPPPGGAAAAAGEVLLKVAWVKMVAATCP